nr:hypothetical protein Iba_chr10eCG12280 [Ipomoea batatas]
MQDRLITEKHITEKRNKLIAVKRYRFIAEKRSIPREPFRSISEELCNFDSEKLYQSNSEELCKSDSEEPCKSNYGEPCKSDSGNRASSTPMNRASPTLRTVQVQFWATVQVRLWEPGVVSNGDGVHHRSPVKTPATHSQCRRYWWCANDGLLVTATSFSSGNVNGHTSHNPSGFSDISCATWNTLRTLLSLETTFRVAQISDEDPEPLRCAFQVCKKAHVFGVPAGVRSHCGVHGVALLEEFYDEA